jgi:hypothetical protein
MGLIMSHITVYEILGVIVALIGTFFLVLRHWGEIGWIIKKIFILFIVIVILFGISQIDAVRYKYIKVDRPEGLYKIDRITGKIYFIHYSEGRIRKAERAN